MGGIYNGNGDDETCTFSPVRGFVWLTLWYALEMISLVSVTLRKVKMSKSLM